jgi:hypothetical protein
MSGFDQGRRDFLRLGLAGGVVLATGSSVALLSGCSANDGPAKGYQVLRPQDLELLRPLMPVLLADSEPLKADPDRPLRVLDDLLMGNSPAGRKQYLQMLDMLQLGAVRWYVSGRWAAFGEQDESTLRQTLSDWANADSGMARLMLRAVNLSTMMAWYTRADIALTTGYPGPPRKIP